MNKEKQKKEIESIYPLTYLQEGMLFHSIHSSDPEIYFEQFTCKISGYFNPSAFKSAWDEAIKRYSIFRTTFAWKNIEQMMQIVLKNSELPFKLLDWRNLLEYEQRQKLIDYLREDKNNGFQLNFAPLMRLALIRLTENDYQFVWSHHHLLMDAWSRSILLRDVFYIYNGLCNSTNYLLKPPRPFRDYVLWLRNQDLKKAEIFWNRYLQNFSTPTPLPFQQVDFAEASKDNMETIFLSDELTAKLNEITHQFNITISTILQCSWAVLLSRYCGENDVVFGITTAGRPPEFDDIESMVGLFINTIPMRVKLDSNEFIRSFLQRIQSEVIELREYEFYSLIQIQGNSEIPRGIPLFNSLVVYENTPFDESLTDQIRELMISDIRVSSKTNYPLVMVASPGSKISVGLVFDTVRYKNSTIRIILNHLLNILNTIAFHHEKQIWQLSLLNEEAISNLLKEYKNNINAKLKPELLHNIFEKQVVKTPDNIAVIYEKESLTYSELDRKANQLANYLISKGIRSDMPVGILVERSIDMIVSILGILKSGAAYLPIDTSYPEERINYIVNDSGMKYLITEKRYLHKIPSQSTDIIYMDSGEKIISQHGIENPNIRMSTDNLAYIIYTSGSTGKPKGVMITHQGLKNILSNMSTDWEIDSKSRLIQFSSIGFDASVIEIFTSLCSGASLYVASKDIVTSTEKTTEFIKENKISFVIFPPTILSLLQNENLNSLKTVVSGGELCNWDIAEKWSTNHKFFNAYGPTEITIACSWGKYDQDNVKESLTFPIGKPFSNVKLYILDKSLSIVPPGVQGEIYVSGPGLARGYLNRPDLTAETFLPDSFSDEIGGRLYRTGDIAKYLINGKIEYLCRNDNQVKIRGFRIELSEIEYMLLHYHGIKNAAVIVKRKKSGDQYLAAYLLLSDISAKNNIEIRKYLSEYLPDYMIPSEYIFLDAFPLTQSGKIDRKSLLSIEQFKDDIPSNMNPDDPVKELLKVIWREVLEVSEIDSEDNFFELGGHSLKATQLVARIKKIFKIEITLKELFSNPTINLLAGVIRNICENGLRRSISNEIKRSSKRDTRENEFDLSFAQQRLWFIEQLSPESSMFHIPIALRLSGKLDHNALKMSLSEIVKRHEAMRTVFLSAEGKPFQFIKEFTEIDLNYCDYSGLSNEKADLEIRKLTELEIKKKFKLNEGPLYRFNLYKEDENEYIFLIVMHHIISDGWSMTVFVRELAFYYKSFINNEKLVNQELPVQYADFAEWQRNQFSGNALLSQLDYWKNELEGVTPLLDLPADYVRPPVQTSNGASEEIHISKTIEKKLNEYCIKEGVTPFMVLLSAFQIFLARLSDRKDIAIGSPVANRTNIDIEKMIGFFVNTLVMRYDFDGSPDFNTVVKKNREKTLLAFANQDMPFDQLVEKLQPERNMSYSPLFQVAFVYQNFSIKDFNLPNITINTFVINNPATKYDITLTISEQSEGMIAYWEYNTDLFKRSTILKRIGQFESLITNLLNYPDINIWQIPIISKVESDLILNKWSTSKTTNLSDHCIHQLFEQIAEKYAGKTAVNFIELSNEVLISRKITFSELNVRANKLAHYLRKMGVKPETHVGLLVPRSIDLVVSVLAILKAGGVFISLDPTYPEERIRYILKDSSTEIIVVNNQDYEKLSQLNDRIIIVNQNENELENCNDENPNNIITTDNLAYIIYTSGSTGIPKGTMLTHKGVCNIASVQKETFEIDHYNRIFQFASSSYDAFVWEFIMALLNGAELQMISNNITASMDVVARIIQLSSTDTITLPPSILLNLPEEDENGMELLTSIKTIIVAGEKCPVELANKWSGRVRFFNAYGPTETTICASVAYCNRQYHDNVPIGNPIGNYELYLLDKHMQLVPAGIPGELYIGGIGLARGYLKKPDLTAEKFVPNPFSSERGSRLYRSGDIVKFSEDGSIEFLERIDSQVKIHGLRIELGEIESILFEHPNIRQVAIKLDKDHFSEERLIAYLTLRNGEETSKDELKSYLGQKIPEYMIPHVYVILDEFPLNKNGKIDYKALPASGDIIKDEINKKYVPPSNEVQQELAKIVMQLLKIEKIGIHDNFFELGGHSLLVSRFASQIRSNFKIEIPLRTIFEHPTIYEIEIFLQKQKIIFNENKEDIKKLSRGTDQLFDLLSNIENMPETEVYRQLGKKNNKIS